MAAFEGLLERDGGGDDLGLGECAAAASGGGGMTRAPLPPLSGDLGYHYIDVLEWDPDAFKNVPDLKQDLT